MSEVTEFLWKKAMRQESLKGLPDPLPEVHLNKTDLKYKETL